MVIETADDLRNLGVEKQTVVVPLSEIDDAPVGDELVYNEPVEALQAAPEWLQD